MRGVKLLNIIPTSSHDALMLSTFMPASLLSTDAAPALQSVSSWMEFGLSISSNNKKSCKHSKLVNFHNSILTFYIEECLPPMVNTFKSLIKIKCMNIHLYSVDCNNSFRAYCHAWYQKPHHCQLDGHHERDRHKYHVSGERTLITAWT